MASFNKVIIMGNLTRDPEIRTIPSGMTVCEITLAVNEKYKDKETVSFVDVTIWGKQAETLVRWKKKGEPLLVEGKLRQESWTDKDSGQKRSKMKVVCDRFTFVGGGQDSSQGGEKQSSKPPQEDYDDYATTMPEDNPRGEPPFS